MAYTAKTAFFADVGVTMFQAGVADRDKRFEEFGIIGGNGILCVPEIEEKTEESMMRHNDPPLLGIQPHNVLHGYIPDVQPHLLWSL